MKISATVQKLANSNNSVPSGLNKGNPSFHLLITNPEQSVALCKTLLSAAVLDYPPPTLLNFNNTSPTAKSHVDGIKAVSDFLRDDSRISDHDLVLIVDGKNTWFQLPPKLIIERYQTVIALSNASSTDQKYGVLNSSTNGDFKSEAGCNHHVVWAAGKIRASAADLAGFSAPVSPMLSVLDANTGSNDKRGPIKNPKYLHSGAVIGPAFQIKAIYLAALAKLENESEPATPDALFSRMFEEQVCALRSSKKPNYGLRSRWLDWLSGKFELLKHDADRHEEQNRHSALGRDYRITLDYRSTMFQIFVQSDEEMQFVSPNNSVPLGHRDASLANVLVTLPPDLMRAGAPFHIAVKPDSGQQYSPSALEFNITIDTLPTNVIWGDLTLLTNLRTLSIPALLNIDGDSEPMKNERWKKMWYHQYARPLLRNALRSSEGRKAAHAAAIGGDTEWDTRGGKGGVWLANKSWMEWGAVCRGYEEELFDDGMGVWDYEGGGHPKFNKYGYLISGE